MTQRKNIRLGHYGDMRPSSMIVTLAIVAAGAAVGAAVTGLIVGHGAGPCDMRLLGGALGAFAAVAARVFGFW